MDPEFIEHYYERVSQSLFTTDQLRSQYGMGDEGTKAFHYLRNSINSLLRKVVDCWKDFDPIPTKVDVTNIVSTFIQRKLGGLDELPPEFTDFIQGAVRDYFGLLEEADKPGWLPKDMLALQDLHEGFELFVKRRANLEGQIQSFPNIIKGIRGCSDPNWKQYSIDYVLDVHKYGIKNADKKPAFWRSIERRFRK